MKLTKELKKRVKDYYASMSEEELSFRYKKFESTYYPQNTLNGLIQRLDANPIEDRLNTVVEMFLLGLPTDLGYRPEAPWKDEEEHILIKIKELSQEISEHISGVVRKWIKEGMPEGY